MAFLLLVGCSRDSAGPVADDGIPEDILANETLPEVSEEVVPEEEPVDPTLVDQTAPVPAPNMEQETSEAETVEMNERTEDAETSEAAGYWYSDIPESPEEQKALRREMRKEVHKLDRELALYRQELIQSTPELAAMRDRLEEARREERERIDGHEAMVELARTQEERKQRYEQLGAEMETLQRDLQAKGEFTPEAWVNETHPVRKGCCSLHFPEVDPNTPGQRYLAMIAERRELLRDLAGYHRERNEWIAGLLETDPGLAALHEEQQTLLTGLDEGVEADETYQRRERELRDLRNKELYLGRVILGDSRYVRNTPSSSTISE